MTDAGKLKIMLDCWQKGHNVDFATGRNMVLNNCADLSGDTLRHLCRMWGANMDEILAGIEYQRNIEAEQEIEALLKLKYSSSFQRLPHAMEKTVVDSTGSVWLIYSVNGMDSWRITVVIIGK